MRISPTLFHRSLAVAALALASPAAAELTRAADDGFVSRHEVVVEASPKEVWLALIAPAGWWRSEHTWSGEAANLTLTPQAGGCFCETIPEVDEPGRFTLQGSVEHMRVIQAHPETALRMLGALGPLQSEPVTGVLTVAISTVEQGTRIVWEYNVGGAMRFELSVISKAVDGVMGAQLTALADLLGPVAMLEPPSEPDPAGDAGLSEKPVSADAGADAGSEAKGRAVEATRPTGKPMISSDIPAPSATVTKPASVDDAFGDLKDSQPRA